MRKIHLIAAGLIGLTLPLLSPATTHAVPGSGAFAPAVDAALVPVADLYVEPRRWRHSHRRPSRPYYAPYADYPAYRYGGYAAYEVYAVYPVYDRPYSYSHMGRYYYRDEPRFYLPGFYSEPPSYYYW